MEKIRKKFLNGLSTYTSHDAGYSTSNNKLVHPLAVYTGIKPPSTKNIDAIHDIQVAKEKLGSNFDNIEIKQDAAKLHKDLKNVYNANEEQRYRNYLVNGYYANLETQYDKDMFKNEYPEIFEEAYQRVESMMRIHAEIAKLYVYQGSPKREQYELVYMLKSNVDILDNINMVIVNDLLYGSKLDTEMTDPKKFIFYTKQHLTGYMDAVIDGTYEKYLPEADSVKKRQSKITTPFGDIFGVNTDTNEVRTDFYRNAQDIHMNNHKRKMQRAKDLIEAVRKKN